MNINIFFILFICTALLEDIANIFYHRQLIKQSKKGLINLLRVKLPLYIIAIATYFLSSIFAFIGVALFLTWQIFALAYEEINCKDKFEVYYIFRVFTIPPIIIVIYLL